MRPHGPNGHVLLPVMEEGMRLMTGPFLDIAEKGQSLPRRG